MIPASTLAVLRQVTEQSFDCSANIVFYGTTPGTAGEHTRAVINTVNNVPCRVVPRPLQEGKEIIESQQLVEHVFWRVTTRINIPLSHRDELVIFGTTDGQPWSKTLVVLYVEAKRSCELGTVAVCDALNI